MTATDAIEVIKQLPPNISATPDTHAQIQQAIGVLELLAKEKDAPAPVPAPVKRPRKRSRR